MTIARVTDDDRNMARALVADVKAAVQSGSGSDREWLATDAIAIRLAEQRSISEAGAAAMREALIKFADHAEWNSPIRLSKLAEIRAVASSSDAGAALLKRLAEAEAARDAHKASADKWGLRLAEAEAERDRLAGEVERDRKIVEAAGRQVAAMDRDGCYLRNECHATESAYRDAYPATPPGEGGTP